MMRKRNSRVGEKDLENLKRRVRGPAYFQDYISFFTLL